MIRIETTAEFKAGGQFIVKGQGPESVTPGPHPVVVMIDDRGKLPDLLPEPASVVVRENGLLFLNAEPLKDAVVDIRALIEADREERMMQILGVWK